MYLIRNDFLPLIQAKQLEQMETSDEVLNPIMAMAEAEVRSHLVQKYIVDAELTDTVVYSNATQYYAGSRVYTDVSGVITMYYGKYPYPEFDLYAQYMVGDFVYYAGHTWKALRQSVIPYYDPQYVTYDNIPYPNKFPTTANSLYWQDLGAFLIPIGTVPTNTTWWVQGDNRNQQLKNYTVDVCLYHIHARLTPNNIPAIREQRYMGKPEDRAIIGGRMYFPEYSALGWLQAASEGRVTAALPPIQPTSGSRIRSGGQIKVNNIY